MKNLLFKNYCWQLSVLWLSLLFLSACNNETSQRQLTSADKIVPVAKSIIDSDKSPVLVKVNSEAITESDLEHSINSLFGKAQRELFDEKSRNKMLESLILSRIMGQAVIKELDQERLENLDKQVQAYRQQLLVKEYLKMHTTPSPVTEEMVVNYYKNNPQRFGERTVKRYAIIASKNKPTAAARDVLIKSLQGAEKEKDWQAFTKTLQTQGHAVRYTEGEAQSKLLHRDLSSVLTSLKLAETSKLTFVQGRIYIARIIREKKYPAQPLIEVRAKIRKSLAPIQLKKAVRQVTENLIDSANIVYLTKAQDGI